jgi:PAS domain-containing protein
MDTQSSAGLQQAKSKQDIFDAAARFERRDDYGSLILDRLGRIISCGIPAERIFGASRVRLVGRLISDFAAGLFPNGSSPSYNARYLVHLCADGQWRKYEARNGDGRPIVVELNLTRLATSSGADREMFLLNVRRPEQDHTGH